MHRSGGTEVNGPVRRLGVVTASSTRGSTTGGIDNRGRTVRNLPYPEFLKMKEEGRCVRCGGLSAPGHHCSEKSLRVLRLAEDEGDDADEGINQDPKHTCSTEGLTQPRTMKLTGMIRDRKVLVHSINGARHNFSYREVAEELKLPIDDIPPYQASLGDGQRREKRRCCEKVAMALGGVDVIVSVEWVGKLGEVMINWKEMFMGYNPTGKRVRVKWTLDWELGQVENEVDGERQSDLTAVQEAELSAGLHQHYKVFQEKKGFPPPRDKEHCITHKVAVSGKEKERDNSAEDKTCDGNIVGLNNHQGNGRRIFSRTVQGSTHCISKQATRYNRSPKNVTLRYKTILADQFRGSETERYRMGLTISLRNRTVLDAIGRKEEEWEMGEEELPPPKPPDLK